jgi:ATP-dependent Zn protease
MRSRPLPAVSAVLALALPLLFLATAALAQEESRPSAIATIFYTWTPVLVIVGLWIYFMRRFGGGKGGYKGYIKASQDRMESIDQSLQRIATQLERLVEVADRPK